MQDSYEATQKDPDLPSFLEDEIDSKVDIQIGTTLFPHQWGKLLSCSGRGSKNNNFIFNSSRISNTHALMYCKQNNTDLKNPYYEAYIEDTSANVSKISNEFTDEIVKNSFIFMSSLPNPTIIASTSRNSVHNQLFVNNLSNEETNDSNNFDHNSNKLYESTDSNDATRSTTVRRLLNQQRKIEDFYVLRDLLGTGTSGLVYRGIQKSTGKEWAIKVIDARKLLYTEGLTSAAITKEAEMLRALRHPYIIHLEDIFADGYNLYLVMELSI
eukprot:gene16608-22691_t